MAGKTVEFSAQVPEEDYQEFLEVFNDGSERPRAMYGASTWLIRNSLSNFLAEVRDSPTLQDSCREAIKKMVEETRS